MRVRMLGTGSADGWPNAFCECVSCATERAAGRVRQPSSALVDDVILIDCGPTAPRVAGVGLRQVEHVLITHGHPDHLDPMALLAYGWAPTSAPLHVWGPPTAIDRCRDWLAPDGPVELHEVGPAEDLVLATARGPYRVHTLPAAHHHGDGDVVAAQAMLYLVIAPDGHRLLYATDTGPLPAAVVAQIDVRLDLLIVDETFGDLTDHGRGHLDLASLPVFLNGLRAVGSIDDRTSVVATHLSHHNPPRAELAARLARIGVLLLDDGEVVDSAIAGGRRPARILLLGGARSGKSTLAESLAASYGSVTYVATGGERPEDGEWRDRVAAHRARRPEHWRTVETSDPVEVLRQAEPGSCVLVDCLTLWLTAVLDAAHAWTDPGVDRIGPLVDRAVEDLLAAVDSCPASVVVVSNEVGLGVVPDTAAGRLFADQLGRVNARVAAHCPDVRLLVAGRPLPLPPTRLQLS